MMDLGYEQIWKFISRISSGSLIKFEGLVGCEFRIKREKIWNFYFCGN